MADGHRVAATKMRVLDVWGVPVVQPAYVTVSANGAEPVGADADASSVGLQQLTDSAGWLVVSLRPGREVRRGVLELKSGDARATVPLEIFPEAGPLTVPGVGMGGAGASPDASGALTARGRLDARTSLTLGVDSRRLNDGQGAFGRSADPLAEAQYPILGDASQLQTRTASQNWVSARLEHGFDWAAFGDLSTTDFASGLRLAQSRRAATGVAAPVTTPAAPSGAARGGAQRRGGGAGAARDAGRLGGAGLVASLRVGIPAVNAEQAITSYRLVGGDVRVLRFGALDVGAEVAYAEQGDSTGVAASAKASYSLFNGALNVGGSYMRIGREFTNPSNVALQPGLTEENLKGGFRVGGTELRAEHARQDFELLGVGREHTRVGIVQTFGPALQGGAGVGNDQGSGTSTASSEVTAGELKAKWVASPQLQFWTEARRHFRLAGPDISPEGWGFGGTDQIAPPAAPEGSQRPGSRPRSQGPHPSSSLGPRTSL